ncbi:MAG: glycosyltransferase, partial [Bacteroidota bacterium]
LRSTERYVLNQARLVHAITPIGARHIAKYTDNQIKTVCNFVPDVHLPPLTKEKDRPICFIGRFDMQQKGIDLQLKAYKLFKKAWKNRKLTPPAFILIGRKTKREQLMVEKLCQDLSLLRNQEVLLTGPVSDYEKYHLLQRSHVYLQLSRYEGFGLSCVEALALGKPIIISSKIPIKDYVQQYDAGWVVNSPREAAKALKEVYQMGERAYHLKSQNARACYEAFFHPDVIKPQLLDMIAQAASIQFKPEAILKSSK